MYMRIGKSLASNGRFSQSELAECLEYDWEDDLEKFGSVDVSRARRCCPSHLVLQGLQRFLRGCGESCSVVYLTLLKAFKGL